MRFKPLNILLLLSLLLTATSCVDDELYENAKVGDGYAMINANVSFFEMPVDLSSRAGENATNPTGGTPGTAIGDIESLCVVVYDKQGNFIRTYTHDPDNNLDQLENYKYTPNSNSETPNDAVGNNEHQAETTTGEAQFSIGTKNIKDRLRYDEYKMYAIANMGQISDEICQQGEEALKTQLLTWNKGNIASNNQMFGYFTLMNGNKKSLDSAGFNAPTILIDKVQSNVHSWIKRAVSKVTVAFDGTNLNDGVQIFIKSVTIKDIPAKCYLGADNPNQADDPATELIENSGQTIVYGTGENYTTDWLGYVSKDHPINGFDQAVVADDKLTSEQKLAQLHSEQTNALFLFENMQGKGKENTPSDKRQQVNQKHIDDKVVSYPDGYDPTDHAWKDAKKYGSYIEVQAYYRALNTNGTLNQTEGEGPITYRFMLGKDTHLDYNTQRNYHYKLTLKFNKWANDVDWHIEYKKKPTKLRFPNPFYISYLYGQPSMIPLEFDATEDVKINKITAKIISNGWAPDDATEYGADLQLPAVSEDYKFVNKETGGGKIVYDAQPKDNDKWFNTYALYLQSLNDPVARPYNGFLSLRKPSNLLVVPGTKPWIYSSNESHYNTNKLGERTYSGTDVALSTYPLYDALAQDKIHVEWNNGTYFVKVPIWTRARQLITETGYTGNNPFQSYTRSAIVHIEIELSNGTILKSDNPNDVTIPSTDGVKDILVRQVRRVVNPKGIWRSNSNSNDFHVVLKILKNENDTKFSDLKSDGPWRAYVIRDTEADDATGEGGFITLEGAYGTTESKTTFNYEGDVLTRSTVEGIHNSKMDFTIKFKGANTGKPRYAVIRVEYNYCSCYHLIFVRQGYEPDDTFDDGRVWMTCNNINQTTVGTDPRDEGSLFRFGNWLGIESESNVNHKSPWVKITPNDFAGNVGTGLTLTNGDKNKNFSDIPGNISPKGNIFPDPGANMRFASYDDYSSFVPENLNDPASIAKCRIKNGYGVLYGDGATETKDNIDEAYGYKRGGNQSFGMRGCFVYNYDTGKNLFFPIGSSGYGHRKNETKNGHVGVLRYSSNDRWGYFNAVSESYKLGVFGAPLFFDIFRSPGAVYWFQTNHADEVAWDINYATFDFKSISTVNVYNSKKGSDACFIRCISTQ